MGITYGSICSGIGSCALAFHSLGWTTAFFSEVAEFPSTVLQQHYPTIPNIGDFTRYEFNERVDLLIAGTPCQSFSYAGFRRGLDDDRGNLAIEYARLIDRLKPRWFIWENVPGVLSSNKGKDFGAILCALAECGYGFAYRVLDAKAFGVPQRRRRVFIVGYFGDWRPPAAVLFESQSGTRDLKESKKPQEEVAPQIARSIGAYGGGRPEEIVVSTTISTHHRYDFDSETFICDNATIRRLSPKECEKLQGLPPDYTKMAYKGRPAELCYDEPRYSAIGNGFAIPVIAWIGKRIDTVDRILTTQRGNEMTENVNSIEDAAADLIATGSKVIEIEPAKVSRMKGAVVRADYGDIDGLMTSIRDEGQIQPIIVRNTKMGYILIAGSRRLHACKGLGINVKAIVVKPRDLGHMLDLQLAENIHRKDFDLLETAEALAARQDAYEQLNPTTKHGAAGRGCEKTAEGATRFRLVMAEKLGVSEPTISRLMRPSTLSAEVKEQVANASTSAERNQIIKDALKEGIKDKKRQALARAAEAVAEKRQEDGADEDIEEGDDLDKDLDGGQEPEAPKPSNIGRPKKPVKKVTPTCTVFHSLWEKGIEKRLKAKSVDLILTDPPYGRERSPISHKDRESINSGDFHWDQLDVGWVVQIAAYLDDNGQLLSFCPLESIGDYEMACKEAGLTYRGAIIWKRTNPGVLHRDSVYLSSCEAIVWATRSDDYYFKPWTNKGQKDVHNYRETPICSGNERTDHPTQKPLALIEDLLLRHSDKGFRVLDPFAGAGTTLVACAKHKRLGLGFEKDKDFAKTANDRIIVATAEVIK